MLHKLFPSFEQFEDRFFIFFDTVLITVTIIGLIMNYCPTKFGFNIQYIDYVLATLAFLGLIPVVISAIKSILNRRISVDLLATMALVFSLLSHEWTSAAFVTLMLAFARVFDHITEARAKKTIQSLMKYHVETVRLRIGDAVKDVHISEVKAGDLVIIESGDRVPVDGIVVSGDADIDESSLTGESELVPKKAGDQVFTSTFNEAGSIIVKTVKVGADTTLARMIALVEDASRNKSDGERVADRFSQWYIGLSLVAAISMFLLGLPLRLILAVLLVVCADDIAVAIPLTFTAAIAGAAKRGVLVKGANAMEQLSKVRYLLTDKTGTLTRGRPKVIDVKVYGPWTREEVAARFVGGASESRHAVSKAIAEYAKEMKIKPHVPDELEEIPGQGISFKHDKENMLLGRLSFMKAKKCRVSDIVLKDIEKEKDAGRGIVCLAVDGDVVGLLSYTDELRPRAIHIIKETHDLGVCEWHMLTGDNEKAAASVAHQLNLRHYHSNLTPEDKVEFIKKFEREHTGKGVVGYIGDGVNDAASLALADVSIAMGGIGADAAIEAADVTIMKDNLEKVPETLRLAQKVHRIMMGNFWIWAVTNLIGLAWVSVGIPGLGVLGPAGAATFNFVTDFFPILNSLRAGRK